ncbi:Myosin regulatory light chain 1 [Cyphellophora attinorum]|uniref:Myosin regulatory light chain 1 n=1 Tax=Cyphellophora attinorum TaxID=1664694 RepID=A0A0N1HXN8_9EURO|nr:Myosin regulatory light chain 1 [Phialophora attinorum]KPI45372.1 Myosin regulatory light chain 1 [Phialophora attinorum]
MTSPSKLKQSYTVSEEEDEDDIISTPTKSNGDGASTIAQHEASTRSSETWIITLGINESANFKIQRLYSDHCEGHATAVNIGPSRSAIQLPPALLHNLRESFSVLDSNTSGSITPASIQETLSSLGIQESNLAQFFPSGQPQQISLPQYLNQLASLLAALSPPQELLNAFSAFDDDDSGQIDVAELKTALMTTLPDPGEQRLVERDIDRALEGYTGRRILGRNTTGISGVRGINSTPAAKRNGGDVFRYQEFVANLTGGPSVMSEPISAGGGLTR